VKEGKPLARVGNLKTKKKQISEATCGWPKGGRSSEKEGEGDRRTNECGSPNFGKQEIKI